MLDLFESGIARSTLSPFILKAWVAKWSLILLTSGGIFLGFTPEASSCLIISASCLCLAAEDLAPGAKSKRLTLNCSSMAPKIAFLASSGRTPVL